MTKTILRTAVLSALAGVALAVALGSLAPTIAPMIDSVPWRELRLPTLIAPDRPSVEFDLPSLWRFWADS